MKRFQSSMLAVILVTGWIGGASAAAASDDRGQKSTQAEVPNNTPGYTHEIYGTIKSIEGSQLTIQTRSGGLVKVDAAVAIQMHLAVPLVVGHAVGAKGTYDEKGVLHAEMILREKESPDGWPADR